MTLSSRILRAAFAAVAAWTVSIMGASAQIKVAVHEQATGQPDIPAEIYGQFSEHLGKCIYEGIWVGPGSSIPNEDGYRTDVLQALKELKVPLLRWPGGCFADEYHWMDGIGPRDKRPAIINSHWGGTLEDNSFGTHEFLDLCEKIGCEPYISVNVGSGTVEEVDKWVQYMTAEGGHMAELRRANGREKPWKVKYIGVGNENWGCGGNMTAEYYSNVYKRYALYARNFGANRLFKVACGASDDDYGWTRTMMRNAGSSMHGLSLHYYTVDWSRKGSATGFTTDDYYNTLGRTWRIEEILRGHMAVMDAFDPGKRIALALDEWGDWFDVEPGTNPGHLFQQNTMRDAMVAAINLNLFNKLTDRLRIANIAQMVNVLQAMILTDGPRMVLTPTYHVFRMFNVHQGAAAVPVQYSCADKVSPEGRLFPTFSASASRDKDGVLHISMANPLADKATTVELAFDSLKPSSVSGEILHADKLTAHNDFGKDPEVAPAPLKGIKTSGKTVKVEIPAASVVVLSIK